MGYAHSECAAMLGFCECDECVSARTPMPTCLTPKETMNLDEWYLWGIRSEDVALLRSHRRDMLDMGFTVGPIEISRGWAESSLPSGWFYFDAKIPRMALSEEQFESLCAWDRAHGELPNKKSTQEGRQNGK